MTIESTILVGGAAGVGATTSGATAPDIQLALRHITAAGSSNGISLDSSAAGQLLGELRKHRGDADGLDRAQQRDEAQRRRRRPRRQHARRSTRCAACTSGDVKALFLDPLKGNYRLRPDSPAIGKGGFVAGESTTDIDGEDRSAAPTDQGADEYNNGAPTAKFVVATPVPRNAQPVRFDATASSDREGAAPAESPSTAGATATAAADVTTVPTVDHVFADEGDAAAGLIVIDKQGAVSPEVAVTFKLDRRRSAGGRDRQAEGEPDVQAVHVEDDDRDEEGQEDEGHEAHAHEDPVRRAVGRQVRRGEDRPDAREGRPTAPTKPKTRRSQARRATARCRFYDPKKGFQLVSCAKPKLITARLIKDDKNGQWTYSIGTRAPAVDRQVHADRVRRRRGRRVRQLGRGQALEDQLHGEEVAGRR